MLIEPKKKDLGDFEVLRVLPQRQQKMVGPWIFFDHLGPAEFEAGKGISVRPHPHINLATVTYLFEGEILHRDSLGTTQTIRPGAINLMVAGKGITHSERQSEEQLSKPHSLHALQLWHALPEESEEIDPVFYHYAADTIPQVDNVRVMMGTAFGVTSPVKTFSETLYLAAQLEQGQELTVPDVEEAAVYIIKGAVKIDDSTEVQQHQMHLITSNQTIKATQPTVCVIIGGEKFSKRYIEWNFVSSRKDRLEQAKRDWVDGKFSKVPGDDEFIPLPAAMKEAL